MEHEHVYMCIKGSEALRLLIRLAEELKRSRVVHGHRPKMLISPIGQLHHEAPRFMLSDLLVFKQSIVKHQVDITTRSL